MDTPSLRNQLLIAMPQLEDPNFHHSVTYLIEHNEEGAMGLTLNRPLTGSVEDVLDDLGIAHSARIGASHQLVAGGPVQPEAGFILHRDDGTPWQHSVAVGDGLCLTTSQDILEAIGNGEGPAQSLLALGYAGWAPGQLEQELSENAWLSVPASPELIFDTPAEQRWQAAAARLGIDVNLISTQAGHS